MHESFQILQILGGSFMEKKWASHLAISSFVCVFLIISSFNMGIFMTSVKTIHLVFQRSVNQTDPKIPGFNASQPPAAPPAPPPLPRFAYLISGSDGDLPGLWRALRSMYHPRNQYVVHLDLKSPLEERLELASRIDKDKVFSEVGNVYMISKANMVTYRGPTMVSNTLHACAILLRRSKDWDWFINLSASDYPMVTQDDLIHTFSGLDRNLNFIDHTSKLGWRKVGRAMPIIMDPGLYSNNKSDIFPVRKNRPLPDAFRLYTGSAWMVLSRAFVEYLILGWDNMPRTMLMYYTNFVSSPEGYFHTVICNTAEFAATAANHDLHYITWGRPPRQHPLTLGMNDTGMMVASNAPFARKFKKDDPVLDWIDKTLLGRINDSFTPGGWCAGEPPCSQVGDPGKVSPGPGAIRLSRLIDRVAKSAAFRRNQCK